MNSPAEISNWRLILVAAALALPLFIVLNGTSLTLPDSFYLVTGIPIHASALLFLLLPKHFLMRRSELLILLVYLIYCVFSLMDSGLRLQTTVQLGYFIYAYKILRGLSRETIRIIDRYIALIGSLFIFIHASSAAHSTINGDIFSSGTNVFGFVIYQSHLTYAIVLVLILLSVHRSFGHRPLFKLVVILCVLLLEVILMRRVGLGLFLVFLFLFERRLLVLLSLITLILVIFNEKINNAVLENISLFGRLLSLEENGSNPRSMTWKRSINYLNEMDIALVGNGLNNHSHNFFLHTITTHGFIVACVFFVFIFYFLYAMVSKVGLSNRLSLLMFAFVAVDWNVNVNLYQPYYSSLFAFFLVSSTLLNGKKNDR